MLITNNNVNYWLQGGSAAHRPQRLYQSPGPHTPWRCVAAINAASQTERFVVSSISTYIGVGSNISTNDGALKKVENMEDSQAAAADSDRTLRRSGRQ